MQNDGFKIVISVEPAQKKPMERYTKYKCCFYEIIKDDIGRRWLQAKKISSYDSIELMEQDIEGFTLFYEYEIEAGLEDSAYERNCETNVRNDRE